MRFRCLVVGVVVLASAVLVSPAAGQSSDPWIGTWKINLAKSKYSSGIPPKSSTVTVVAADGGFKQTIETVPGGLGFATRSEVVAKFDGKDTRVRGNPNVDASAYRRIDARSYEVISKKDGKVTLTSIVTISADGRTRTVTQTGTDARGQKVNNTIVYDRR